MIAPSGGVSAGQDDDDIIKSRNLIQIFAGGDSAESEGAMSKMAVQLDAGLPERRDDPA
jgi:hypothetical protein